MASHNSTTPNNTVRTIEQAEDGYISVDEIDGQDIRLCYRTWGNRTHGIPVLFVHGGPGNCVANYGTINGGFFNAEQFFVVEVDQRGTGKSEPSVRDTTPTEGTAASNRGVENMRLYRGIGIEQMSHDFEIIRPALGIAKWMVFGGSWGSTLGIDYAERYPKSCLGLIVRGIFLSTEEEMDAVYTYDAIRTLVEKTQNSRYLKEFDTFFQVANKEYTKILQRSNSDGLNVLSILGRSKNQDTNGALYNDTENPNDDFPLSLDRNDAYRILKVYEHLVQKGDREAIWKFYVFEENLMAEDESELLDPESYDTINELKYAEAQSVSFFEVRLFLKGAYESSPSELDLLGSVGKLESGNHGVPVWVVQGTGDKVCPDTFAQKLVAKLQESGVLKESYFVDAGHKASSKKINDKLKEVVEEFYKFHIEATKRIY